MFTRAIRNRVRLIVPAVLALILSGGGLAWAIGPGLLNPSFEEGSGNQLDSWTLKAYSYGGGARSEVYGPDLAPVPCEEGDPYGICVVEGADTFTARSGGATRQYTVPAIDGSKMVRMSGPFSNRGIRQAMHGMVIEQSFKVDPQNPVLDLNYNLFTYDYEGFDRLRLLVRLTSPGETPISDVIQGGFGSGTNLKTTGWQDAGIDLTPFIGQEVNLEIELRGTSDRLYGSWAYLDAGTAPSLPIGSGLSATVPPATPNGQPVNISQYTDPGTGQVFLNIPASQVAEFENGCMPLTLTFPINAGSGQVSNVSLRIGDKSLSAAQLEDGSWQVEITCVETGDALLLYTLTEGDQSQEFIIPVGGVTLIDPQGVVYDTDLFDAAKAEGKTDEEARAAAAISGASVRLQRLVDGTFTNVLSGDPGISPNLNPQVTGANGLYQWDVSEGIYRVVVTKNGYPAVTSNQVDIPPPVLDLHIPMTKPKLSVEKSGLGQGSITSTPAGINCGADCSESFDYESQVTLTASAATGSNFTGWSGACSGETTCQVTMDEARSVTATFTLQKKELTVSKSGSGSGTITSTPAGIDCGSDCSESLDYGTQVTLTASAATGSNFTGWSGACSGQTTCQVTMDEARSVTATFTLQKKELTVSKLGSGSGTITSTSAGIDCGSDCSESLDYGTQVTLTASAATGSNFTGWSGACSGQTTCQVTMDEAKSVIAQFTAKPALATPVIKAPKKAKKGKKATFKVTVKNIGGSTATGVKIGAKGKKIKASKMIGSLAAGKSKTVPISIKFAKAGRVKVTFTVTSTNAGKKTATAPVRVR